MADINHVVLVGRLTRDPELKYTQNGQAVCKFSIAVNRARKQGDQWIEEANFFDIVLWGRQGEALTEKKFLVKGKLVGIDGELRQDRWQQDGQNRSKVEVVASNVQLLGGTPGGGVQSSGNDSEDSGGRSSYSAPERGKSGGEGTPPADDGFADDIPF
ncbi:MAG: single-stranded DNA-binding protein [Treponema sp.]|jgi:single-strand DNA-binding protein|nr:single-stranded DNA-binding protein [Treponema sp.]